MKKLLVTVAACGLFSGVAAAEPLTLEDGELRAVKGGVSVTTFDSVLNKFEADVGIGLSLLLGGKNNSWVGQEQFVQNSSGGTVDLTQNASVTQNAGVNLGNINLDLDLLDVVP